MPDVLVVQYKSSMKGGAQSVCLQAIEALQRDHNVTFLVPSPDDVKIKDINEFHDTDIDDTLSIIGGKYYIIFDKLNSIINRLPNGGKLDKLIRQFKRAYFIKKVKDIQVEYELIFWFYRGPDMVPPFNHEKYFSDKELDEGNGIEVIESRTPSIRYIHCPYYISSKGPNNVMEKGVGFICNQIINPSKNDKNCDYYITNSKWTSNLIELQGYETNVVYPPVDTDGFYKETINWEDMENGFVCSGRITKDKNIPRVISIIENVVDEGYDIHLHIVGIKSDAEYYDHISNKCAQKDFLIFEGEVSKERLATLIANHKFAIHGKENERFGISVAEYVAGTTIPFVPNSGGQTEIVMNHELLTYDNIFDATNNIGRVIESEEKQQQILSEIQSSLGDYSKSSFESSIYSHIDDLIDNTD